MLNSYICSVDIGSSKIAASAALVSNKRVSNIYFESVPCKSLKAGAVIDAVSLVGSLDKVLKQLKVKSGIKIKSIHINVSGSEIVTKHSFGVIPLAERGNKVITLNDVQRVNEQALLLAANLEEELINHIPVSYSIDSRKGILNPLGLYSHRLETDLYLISVKLGFMQNIGRIVNQAGYEISTITFSGLASARAVFDKALEHGQNVLCDIGSDVTELLIFSEGTLCDIIILPLGGDMITQELSDALKIPLDLAEETKCLHGKVADTGSIGEDNQVLIKKDDIYKAFGKKLICELVTRQSRIICEAIKENLCKKTDLGKINNFICIGRTILLEGFLEALENTLGIRVKIGRIADPDLTAKICANDELSGQKYLNYITSLGIIAQNLKDNQQKLLSNQQPQGSNPLFKALNRIKEVYEEYF